MAPPAQYAPAHPRASTPRAEGPGPVAVGVDLAGIGAEPGVQVELHVDVGVSAVDVLDAPQQGEHVWVGRYGEGLAGLDAAVGRSPAAAPDERAGLVVAALHVGARRRHGVTALPAHEVRQHRR